MKHKTLLWDAKLGQIWLKHRRELTSAGFHDGSGINKLRYLRHALSAHEGEHREVYSNICSTSYRDFSSYAISHVGDRRVDFARQPARREGVPSGTVVCSDDTLILKYSSGRSNEIIWINPEFFGNESAYARFRTSIATVVRAYLGKATTG